MGEIMKEKDRREHDPFNPKNWNDEYDIGCSVGKFDLLCKCGHACLWHHSTEVELNRIERRKKELEDDIQEMNLGEQRRQIIVDVDLFNFSPVSKLPEKEEDEVHLIGGKIIRKKNN